MRNRTQLAVFASPFGISCVVGAVFGVVALLAWAPHEDAAMLFAYSENLAAGQGIVFNPGGPPVDGASDMLFMLTVSILVSLGFATAFAAVFVNSVGVVALFFCIQRAWVRVEGLGRVAAHVPGVLVCFSVLWAVSAAGFGLAFFAGLTALVTLQAIRFEEVRTRGNAVRLGALVGLLGLDRMEGFVLGGLIVLTLAVVARDSRFLLMPGVVAASIAAAFISWRWWYFGYPLPNPFYKKGGGALYLDSIPPSIVNLVLAALPWIAILVLGLSTASRRRSAATLVILGGGWALLWMALSNETNYLGRFQFPVVPALAMLSAPVFESLRQAQRRQWWRSSRGAETAVTVAVALCILASVSVPGWMIARGRVREDGLHEAVALALRPFGAQQSRKLAVTEAGFAAWKSDWYVIDLWGLNDQHIAHHGYLKSSDLRRIEPDIIFAHVPSGPDSVDSHAGMRRFLVDWDKMTDPLLCFVQDEGYQVLASWRRSENDTFVVYGRPNLRDSAEISTALQDLPDVPPQYYPKQGRPAEPNYCPD